jgi:hypothetical protein
MSKRTRSRQRYGGLDGDNSTTDLSNDTTSSTFTPPSMGGRRSRTRSRSGGKFGMMKAHNTQMARPSTTSPTNVNVKSGTWGAIKRAFAGGRTRSRSRSRSGGIFGIKSRNTGPVSVAATSPTNVTVKTGSRGFWGAMKRASAGGRTRSRSRSGGGIFGRGWASAIGRR